MPAITATPVVRVIIDKPARIPAITARVGGAWLRMASSATSAAVSTRAANGTSVIRTLLTSRTNGWNAHRATMTMAGQSPTPFSLRSSANAAAKNQQPKNAVTDAAGVMFDGKEGHHLHTQESSQVYSTGYLVWGGPPGRLGIMKPFP